MLVRDTTLATPEKILSDNLTHKPSVGQSVWENFATGFATAPYAIKTMNSEFAKSPEGQGAAGIFEAVKRGNENPEIGWKQWTANEVANMVGQGLNPMSWALGGAGAKLIKPATTLVEKLAPNALTALARTPLNKLLAEPFAKYLPETLERGAEKKTLSLGLLGHEVAEGFGIGAGIGLPQETVNNFNAETGNHDILGIAKGMGVDGVLGMVLSPIPFAWGVLKANVNRARGLPSGFHVEHGEAEPHLSPQDHETWQAIDNHVQNPESRAAGRDDATVAAQRYLARQGVSPNLEIMNKEQVDNFQAATVDHLLSDYIPEEHRTGLTDFTINAAIDEGLDKPHLYDGVRGYVEYADRNLEQKGDILAKADALVDQHLQIAKDIEENTKFERLKPDFDIKNQKFYHGTANIEDISDFDISHLQETSLYGPGLYITDNKRIALGYAEARQKFNNKRIGNGKILELKFKEKPKLIDIQEKPSKEVFDIIRKTNNESSAEKISEKLSDKSLEDIFKIIRENFEDEDHEILGELLYNINHNLDEAGYDGFIHSGGIRGGQKHNVAVLFGHDYVLNEKHYSKSPAIKLHQHAIEMAHDFSMDQKALARIVREHAEGNHLPFTVPKNVIKHVDQGKKIEELQEKNERLFKKYKESGSQSFLDEMKANNTKIDALYEKQELLKSAYEELNDLRKSLITEKGLKRNYERTPEFHRLQELADVWAPARTLLDRINLERRIREQEAYRDLAQAMLNIADGNLGKLADVDKVKGYLEARQAPQIETGNKSATMESVKKDSKVPTDADTIIAEQDRAVENKGGKTGQHDYEAAKDKFDEFKKSEGIFKNFISCVLGGQNG